MYYRQAIAVRPLGRSIMLAKQRNDDMADLFIGKMLLTSLGFVGGVYVLLSMYVAPAILGILGQQPFPDWSGKDWAAMGTSGIFASFMCWLHVRSCDRFDAKLERKDRIILKMLDKGYELPPSD